MRPRPGTTSRLAALLATICLLAGCDGGLQFDGRVVRADGQPAPYAKVTITVGKDSPRAGEGPAVYMTDRQGRFGVTRVDCRCDFDVRIDAVHSEYGRARLDTTHDELGPDQDVVLTLDGIPDAGGTPR